MAKKPPAPAGLIKTTTTSTFKLPDLKTLTKWATDAGYSSSDIKEMTTEWNTMKGELYANVNGAKVAPTSANLFTNAWTGLSGPMRSLLSEKWGLPSEGSNEWSRVATNIVDQTQQNGGFMSQIDPGQVRTVEDTIVQDAKANALATSQATASAQANAFDNVANYLDQWGLGSMSNYVKQLVTQNGSYLTNVNALLDAVRNYKAPDGTSPYEAAFPGLKQHNNSVGPGSEHMTEAQYQQYVQAVQGLAGQYALPNGFITKQNIGNWIANNVSASEIEQRMKYGYEAAAKADANTQNILKTQYGMNMGQIAAYMLDPTHALDVIEKQVASATLQGYAQDVGLKGVGQKQGEELANMVNVGAGSVGSGDITTRMSGVQSALLQASRDQPLTAKAPGTAGTTIDTNQLIGAQLAGFGGTTQAADQAAVQRAEQSRTAQFQQGGGFEESQKGVIGAGSAKV